MMNKKVDSTILHEVIKRLVGPIDPVGETIADSDRFDNLKMMTYVVEHLMADIERVAVHADRKEFSMKRAGQYAKKFYGKLPE